MPRFNVGDRVRPIEYHSYFGYEPYYTVQEYDDGAILMEDDDGEVEWWHAGDFELVEAGVETLCAVKPNKFSQFVRQKEEEYSL